MKNKSFFIIISFILLIILGLLVYYFNLNDSNGMSSGLGGNNSLNNSTTNSGNGSSNNNSNNHGSSSNNEITEVIQLTQLNDYNMFFTLNNIINLYYQDMVEDNKDSVFSRLDETYKKEHKITIKNIKNFMEKNYQSISFYAKNIYVKGINNTLYYFIEGENQLYNFAAETLKENDAVNFLLIIDQSQGTYTITPLDTDITVKSYAKNYKLKNLSINANDYNSYDYMSYETDDLAIHYISYFKNLLFLNTEKAYALLNDTTKKIYPTYKDFNNNIEEIYDNLSTNLFSYSDKGNDGQKTISVITNEQIKITFVEKSIMNFTIKIES